MPLSTMVAASSGRGHGGHGARDVIPFGEDVADVVAEAHDDDCYNGRHHQRQRGHDLDRERCRHGVPGSELVAHPHAAMSSSYTFRLIVYTFIHLARVDFV